MGDSNSLINFGDLSKPATVLIEKISNAVGWIAEPHQVIRMANSKAKAEEIKAMAKMKLPGTLERLMAEEIKKEANIGSIIEGALPQLKEDAKPEEIDNDWLAHYFDKCRLVSNEEMQIIWSKILAEEANSPGHFSKRTIDTLASLDKEEALIFTKLCGYKWSITDNKIIIYNVESEIYKKNGINFGVLMHLQDIGLLTFDSLRGFALQGFSKNLEVKYFEKKCIIEFQKDNDNSLVTGDILLSSVGHELSNICGSEPVDGFYEFVLQKWKKGGLKVQEI